MKVLIGNTYLLSPAHTYLDIFKTVGYLNPIPNRDTWKKKLFLPKTW